MIDDSLSDLINQLIVSIQENTEEIRKLVEHLNDDSEKSLVDLAKEALDKVKISR